MVKVAVLPCEFTDLPRPSIDDAYQDMPPRCLLLDRACGGVGPCRSVRDESEALWRHIPLVLLFGVSAHAAKNALAPAQPALEDMGVSPVLYSILAISPMFGSVALPAVWGHWYSRHERSVLIAVPLGELLGQLVIAVGTVLLKRGDSSVATALLSFGVASFSFFHAGAGVVQHAVLARVLPYCLTTGFVAIIGCTHLVKAVCNFTMPWVLRHGGLLGVQWILLVPSVVSLYAGCRLAASAANFTVPHVSAAAFYTPATPGQRVPLLDASTPIESHRHGAEGCLKGLHSIILLGVWRALILGTLHAFGTVYNGLLMSYCGLSQVAAGTLVGTNESIALCILPMVGIISDVVGRRALMCWLSWLTLGAVVVLAFAQDLPTTAWSGATFVIAVTGTVMPVLPLALVPANSERSLGTSYGALESLTGALQVFLTLAIGFIKADSGYPVLLAFVCTFLFVGAVASVCLLFIIKDVADAPVCQSAPSARGTKVRSDQRGAT